MRTTLLTCILTVIFITGCANNTSFLFDKMVNKKNSVDGTNVICLYSYDLHTGEQNEYHEKLYKKGSKINNFLLQKANQANKTNYIIPNIVSPLTDGDIAISLLLDINQITDSEFKLNLITKEIEEDYNNSGSTVWWKWIHENIENRKWVISQIKILIEEKNKP